MNETLSQLLGLALLSSGVILFIYMFKLKIYLTSGSAFLRVILGLIHITNLANYIHDMVPYLFIVLFINDMFLTIYRTSTLSNIYVSPERYSRQILFIFNRSKAGIIIVENRKKIIFLNSSMAHILGGCVLDFADLDIQDVISNQMLEKIYDDINKMGKLPLTIDFEVDEQHYNSTFLKTVNGTEIITGIITHD